MEASLDLTCTQLPCFNIWNYMKSFSNIFSIKILISWTSINTRGCIFEIFFKFVVFNPRGVLSLCIELLCFLFNLSFEIRFSVLLIVDDKVKIICFCQSCWIPAVTQNIIDIYILNLAWPWIECILAFQTLENLLPT